MIIISFCIALILKLNMALTTRKERTGIKNSRMMLVPITDREFTASSDGVAEHDATMPKLKRLNAQAIFSLFTSEYAVPSPNAETMDTARKPP